MCANIIIKPLPVQIAKVNSFAGQSVGSGIFSPESGVAPDILSWTFPGATDAIASGEFSDSGLDDFIPDTAWTRDNSIFETSGQSVRNDVAPSMGPTNNGNTFFLHQGRPSWPGDPMPNLFVRIRVRFETGFFDDVIGFTINKKLIRFQKPSFSNQQLSTVAADNTQGIISAIWDTDAGGEPMNPNQGPSGALADFYDEFVYLEQGGEMTPPDQNRYRAWINGVLISDYTKTFVPSDPDFGMVSLDGAINAHALLTSYWIDRVDISTQHIGLWT